MTNYEEKARKMAKNIVKMDKDIRKKHILAKIKIDAYNKKVTNGKK